eukprot:NODE_193_length_13314_cov_0.305638.p1 type:complete len:1213 gc:universal NODE_193_length_13314_cov_0.305638:5726-2088(-)
MDFATEQNFVEELLISLCSEEDSSITVEKYKEKIDVEMMVHLICNSLKSIPLEEMKNLTDFIDYLQDEPEYEAILFDILDYNILVQLGLSTSSPDPRHSKLLYSTEYFIKFDEIDKLIHNFSLDLPECLPEYIYLKIDLLLMELEHLETKYGFPYFIICDFEAKADSDYEESTELYATKLLFLIFYWCSKGILKLNLILKKFEKYKQKLLPFEFSSHELDKMKLDNYRMTDPSKRPNESMEMYALSSPNRELEDLIEDREFDEYVEKSDKQGQEDIKNREDKIKSLLSREESRLKRPLNVYLAFLQVACCFLPLNDLGIYLDDIKLYSPIYNIYLTRIYCNKSNRGCVFVLANQSYTHLDNTDFKFGDEVISSTATSKMILELFPHNLKIYSHYSYFLDSIKFLYKENPTITVQESKMLMYIINHRQGHFIKLCQTMAANELDKMDIIVNCMHIHPYFHQLFFKQLISGGRLRDYGIYVNASETFYKLLFQSWKDFVLNCHHQNDIYAMNEFIVGLLHRTDCLDGLFFEFISDHFDEYAMHLLDLYFTKLMNFSNVLFGSIQTHTTDYLLTRLPNARFLFYSQCFTKNHEFRSLGSIINAPINLLGPEFFSLLLKKILGFLETFTSDDILQYKLKYEEFFYILEYYLCWILMNNVPLKLNAKNSLEKYCLSKIEPDPLNVIDNAEKLCSNYFEYICKMNSDTKIQHYCKVRLDKDLEIDKSEFDNFCGFYNLHDTFYFKPLPHVGDLELYLDIECKCLGLVRHTPIEIELENASALQVRSFLSLQEYLISKLNLEELNELKNNIKTAYSLYNKDVEILCTKLLGLLALKFKEFGITLTAKDHQEFRSNLTEITNSAEGLTLEAMDTESEEGEIKDSQKSESANESYSRKSDENGDEKEALSLKSVERIDELDVGNVEKIEITNDEQKSNLTPKESATPNNKNQESDLFNATAFIANSPSKPKDSETKSNNVDSVSFKFNSRKPTTFRENQKRDVQQITQSSKIMTKQGEDDSSTLFEGQAAIEADLNEIESDAVPKPKDVLQIENKSSKVVDKIQPDSSKKKQYFEEDPPSAKLDSYNQRFKERQNSSNNNTKSTGSKESHGTRHFVSNQRRYRSGSSPSSTQNSRMKNDVYRGNNIDPKENQQQSKDKRYISEPSEKIPNQSTNSMSQTRLGPRPNNNTRRTDNIKRLASGNESDLKRNAPQDRYNKRYRK